LHNVTVDVPIAIQRPDRQYKAKHHHSTTHVAGVAQEVLRSLPGLDGSLLLEKDRKTIECDTKTDQRDRRTDIGKVRTLVRQV
jgi:hypothetical protein